MSPQLNELQDEKGAVLRLLKSDRACQFSGVAAEWAKTSSLSFAELPKAVCAEKWSAEAVNRANAFNERVEREYVIVSSGAKSCVITQLFAESL